MSTKATLYLKLEPVRLVHEEILELDTHIHTLDKRLHYDRIMPSDQKIEDIIKKLFDLKERITTVMDAFMKEFTSLMEESEGEAKKRKLMYSYEKMKAMTDAELEPYFTKDHTIARNNLATLSVIYADLYLQISVGFSPVRHHTIQASHCRVPRLFVKNYKERMNIMYKKMKRMKKLTEIYKKNIGERIKKNGEEKQKYTRNESTRVLG